MELGEVPVVGEPLKRTVQVAEQSMRAGVWALRTTVGVIENRLEERSINHWDVIARQDFDKVLAENLSAAEAEASIEAREQAKERAIVELKDIIRSESVCGAAAGTLHVYLRHYKLFYERNNFQKTSYYAQEIYPILPFAPEGFSLEAELGNPRCAQSLAAKLRMISKQLEKQKTGERL